MKKRSITEIIIKKIHHYLVFFMLVAFVITCCMMLFVTTLTDTLGIEFTDANISDAAKITFLNVVLLSFIFMVLDTIRKKITVEKPVKQIAEAASKIVQGDFNVKIKKQNKYISDDNFNQIIECFNTMTEELGSVETLRTDFVSNVSHELKTPLSVIQNYATLLQKKKLSDDERIEYAKGVVEGTKRMSEMITNILKLNRLENQNIFPDVEEYDLGAQICDCLLQYEKIWEESGININVDIEENVIVKTDAELIGIVWNNLFSNAFKFTEMGGSVSVSLSSTDDYAIAFVKDSGCGMTEEVGKHIFEKFYQGESSHAGKGNGLGLALVKRVIDIIHGEISVESSLGIGTTFVVKIPISV